MSILLVLTISLVCAVVCHFIAKTRGLHPVFWGMMGLLFGPLALPFVFLTGRSGKDH